MQNTRGATRLLLVIVLVAATAMLGAAVLLLGGGLPDSPEAPDSSGDRRRLTPEGDFQPTRPRPDPDGEDDANDEEDFVYVVPEHLRDASGAILHVNAETLQDVLDKRIWEEVRRQIDQIESGNGQIEQVPESLVRQLLAMLAESDLEKDAMLSLGLIKNASAGQMIAEAAANPTLDAKVRMAALDALARSGNAAGLTQVQALVRQEGTSDDLLRHALPALAAIGGDEAVRTLTEMLLAHPDDRLTSSAVTALGKASGAGPVLAQTMREARDRGDTEVTKKLVTVALIHGANAAKELRLEILNMIQDPNALQFIESDDERLRMRGSALAAASAMGGDLLDPVIRMAANDEDGLRGVALHCLRHARGDDAATKIDVLFENASDENMRYNLVAALGETRSTVATDRLVSLLDDDSDNVRHAAAKSLELVRDPKSVKPMLDRLEGARTDNYLARNLLNSLGVIGHRDALPVLQEMRDDASWKHVRNFIRSAIDKIESGNAESQRLR